MGNRILWIERHVIDYVSLFLFLVACGILLVAVSPLLASEQFRRNKPKKRK